MKQKIAVGMSGGVDSSVVAALLVGRGYEVTGVYIEAYNEPGCRADNDKRDALRVATKLGIPFQVLDWKKEYRESVIKYFYDEYQKGRTPNPDVMCNSLIKFGLFLDWALRPAQGKLAFDKVATGHYARISNQGSVNSKQYLLQRGKDKGKDQSYFLWRVDPERLENVMFPLGEMTKSDVREKARELGLPNADKPDSMGVCMMGELDVMSKLREELGEKVGEVVMGGIVVGEHRGLWFSTIGQRVGEEISLRGDSLQEIGVDTTRMPPLYVVGKDVERNGVVIGRREDGYVNRLKLEKTKEYVDGLEGEIYLRVRNLGKLVEIESLDRDGDVWNIKLGEKIWGVASGQSGVIYDNQGRVVGGGIIV